MIKVERKSAPEIYFSEIFSKEITSLLKFGEAEAENRAARRSDSRIRLETKGLQQFKFELTRLSKEKLAFDFNFKCAYCESRTEGELEHFRPKSSARGLNGEFSYMHYWWLQYEWTNLYYSCSVCNRNKGSWFPVEGLRAEILTPASNIFKEKNLIIDPCNDNPEDQFSYDESGFIIPLHENAKVTIDILKLNRKQLVDFRREAYREQLSFLKRQEKLNPKTIRRLDESSEEIMSGISKSEYLGIRRFVIKNWLENIKRKKRGRPKATVPTTVGNSYVSNIEIKNFKKIRNLKFEVSDAAAQKKLAPWTVILGENGVGKSSILQAIGLTLVDSDYLNGLSNSAKILNDKSKTGLVNVKLDNGNNPCSITFNKTTNKIETNFRQAVNHIIGFGSTRLYKQEGISNIDRSRKYYRIGNLYKHYKAIEDPEKWLLGLKGKIFQSAARVIFKALGFDYSWRMFRRKNRIYVARGTKEYLLENMSDGYKSTISLVTNIMSSLSKSTKGFDDISGIVFIDEIELHLHPNWKMKFVRSFRNAFPKIQVFATTHDPLCLKGLLDGEVILLKEMKSGRIECVTELPSVMGLKAEQLLTSEFFGLSSTIDPEDEEEFNSYYYLLGKSNRTEKQQADLDELQINILSKRQLGDSLRDELMMFAADEVIAKEYLTGKKLKRDDLKKATADVLRNILKKDNI